MCFFGDLVLIFGKLTLTPRASPAADVIYHPSKFRNRLPFELKCSATTHFKGFVELSSLPLYLVRVGGGKVV